MKKVDWTWLLIGAALGLFVVPNLKPILARATTPVTRK